MQTISCPNCGDPLGDAAGYCLSCGQAVRSSEVTRPLKRSRASFLSEEGQACVEWTEAGPTDRLPPRGAVAPGLLQEKGETGWKLSVAQETPEDLVESTLNLRRMRRGARERLEADMLGPLDQGSEEDQDDELVEQRATWQKVVERRTGISLPAVAALSPGAGLYQRLRTSLQPDARSPRIYFWLSALLLVCLLLASGFGVAISAGRRVPRPARVTQLQAFPQTIALGGIITLRGAYFTAHSQVRLSRDNNIPVDDTGGAGSVRADTHGFFSDTVIVDPAWLAGPHILFALDEQTHQQVLTRIVVIGEYALQGPPRLLLSAAGLDFGTGDEATSASQLLALSNAGGGEVTWQAAASQPWLEISPMSGSIPSGSHLSAMVAVDRARLAPGTYHASLLFLSNTERVSLPVTMAVVPLQPEHEAVLQTSPATLAFSGSARGPGPRIQAVLVSNPGVLQLSWEASITLQNGSGWLWMGQQAGNIAPGGQQQVTVGVSTQNLTPGLYKGKISFVHTGAQPVRGSPQDLYVSLTLTPPCVLSLAPGGLSFTGAHAGASPAPRILRISVAPGCAATEKWSASVRTTSGGNWLQLGQAHGATPAALPVRVNTAALGPGVYSGVLTFTVATGPQIVPVTLTINPIPCTISEPPLLDLQGIAGQTGAVVQAVTLTTGGDCPHTLNWAGMVNGATWLSVTSAGTLTQPGTASVSVQASLAGLGAGSYTGQVVVTASDSVTGQRVGIVQTSVTLNVQPPCTMQEPAPASLTFTAGAGSVITQSATVTVAVNGSCAGAVTITPTTDSSWLDGGSMTSLAGGGTATFTITIDPTSLVANTYTGTITLAATDTDGTLAGSGQMINVTLTIQ